MLGLKDKLQTLKDSINTIDKFALPQLTYISTNIEKMENEVKAEASNLLNRFMFGESSTQPLPEIKPPMRKASVSRLSESFLKDASKPPRFEYTKKKTTLPRKYSSRSRFSNSQADAPCITEDDISKGMLNLIAKGVIPKDVDLTPAFERGAPPISSKRVTL